VARHAGAHAARVGAQIVTLREDAHVSQRRLANETGVDQSHLSRIERGLTEPSFAVLESIAGALGATVSIRLMPTTGPRIRDQFQAPMVEAVLEILDPTWRKLVEVTVYRPSRGTIDLVLARPIAPVIAGEIHSELRRLEQQLRWANDKAEALPSADAWSFLAAESAPGPVSRLLVLRSTRANRDLARSFERTLQTAYPGRPEDAVRALRAADRVWPGPSIIWAEVAGGRARILDGPPRGVALGR
jgi:transcriptional regulator with XRE-family HTH domain